MSSHAEAQHGNEHSAGHESAVESLFDGISKIISSVKIAVGKVYDGLKGMFHEIVDAFKSKPGAHAQEAHAHAPAEVAHATKVEHAH